jgi:hypothetical protein
MAMIFASISGDIETYKFDKDKFTINFFDNIEDAKAWFSKARTNKNINFGCCLPYKNLYDPLTIAKTEIFYYYCYHEIQYYFRTAYGAYAFLQQGNNCPRTATNH